MYFGKSNGLAEALVAQGSAGPVRLLLSNPAANTSQVVGTLYRKDRKGTSHQITKFAVDVSQSTIVEPGPLGDGECFYLTLDAAPTAQLAITSW